MKIYQFIISCLVLGSQTVVAQNARFTNQGVIEYEKKVNMYALIKDQVKKNSDRSYYAQAFEDYQKKNPQFKVLKSTLKFSKEQTLFTPIEEDVVGSGFFDFESANQHNTTATNTNAGTVISQKKVFEETYLLKDSTRKINWKITNEIRNIAGYDCRRANALIMDSIYVVAFYTEEIPVSGGPETFSGLPGMILGVALPYEHITWFATSVLDQPVTDDKLKAPVKGKPVDSKQLTAILKAATKDWGEWGQDSLKAFLL
ncbi:GLPGLI family protein [Pedobacter frigiditerrae]|uniref:GLPGLI family protein n=1 Tax=Pedobacter frigiditerrae TaxID=2530452 RepID=A0A4R0N5B4_9SPHI|nr:GLPGLI family protein [Pedobacter frigiditerrae]TCC93444.1 GLPGLI family protein [Pedobacter frigiditerrae]